MEEKLEKVQVRKKEESVEIQCSKSTECNPKIICAAIIVKLGFDIGNFEG